MKYGESPDTNAAGNILVPHSQLNPSTGNFNECALDRSITDLSSLRDAPLSPTFLAPRTFPRCFHGSSFGSSIESKDSSLSRDDTDLDMNDALKLLSASYTYGKTDKVIGFTSTPVSDVACSHDVQRKNRFLPKLRWKRTRFSKSTLQTTPSNLEKS